MATNLDDIVILMLFFAQRDNTLRPSQVVIGQYLGFSILVILSLPGFFGGLLVPKPWIGLLGFLPILIGLKDLAKWNESKDQVQGISRSAHPAPKRSISGLNSQTYRVAAVTVANGGDNIGIYLPLFASGDWIRLMVILAVFFVLLGVWCFLGYRLAIHPTVASLLGRYSRILIPFILIGLGSFILLENETLNLLREFVR